ncbi:TonB-dependent receptor [Microbulbifer elongatus]|uniref:TonB-dependent receptor n=1 Tax=Microbulbifer elongatus TaxID=86173 RepID=UPI001E46F4CA|nr:TonB-dependent receptor [Microbulbifer elongatus]
MRPISIPAGPLAAALESLSQRYETPFAVDSRVIDARISAPLKGYFTLEAALAQLLAGSGLRFKLSPAGVIITEAAQDTADSEIIEEFEVTGISHRVDTGHALKHQALEVTEIVTAWDMAHYPDSTAVAALQRVPGVAIQRESGEGRQVSLRGLRPDFTQVTVNGMPVLVDSDSPMDSRTQKQRDRAFDLNVFSAGLFDRATVRKSYSSREAPGGIAGTVALETVRPLEDGPHPLYLSASGGWNEYVEGGDQQWAAQWRERWPLGEEQEWGLALALSHDQRALEERGTNTFRWQQSAANGADLSALPDDVRVAWERGDLVVPRGNRHSLWRNHQERYGAALALLYQRQRQRLELDLLYGRLDSDRDEFHLYPRGEHSTPVIPGHTKITQAEVSDSGELLFADYTQAEIATESRYQHTSTDYRQVVLSGDHGLSELLALHWRVGWQASDFDIPVSHKAYLQRVGDVSIDYRSDRFWPTIKYADDLMDLNFWALTEIDLETYRAAAEYQDLELVLTHRPANTWTIEFGLRQTRFHSRSDLLRRNNLPIDGLPISLHASHPTWIREVDAHPAATWPAVDDNLALAGIDLTPYQGFRGEGITEDDRDGVLELQRAAFTALTFNGGRVHASAALRALTLDTRVYATTRLVTGGIEKVDSATGDNAYNTLLPSANLSIELSDTWQLRTGLSRNIAYPLLDDLTGTPTAQEEYGTLFLPNPTLSPYTSDNMDLELTGSHGAADILSVGLFHKSISDFIVARQFNYGAVVDDTTPLNAPPTEPVLAAVRMENAENATLAGLEAAATLRYGELGVSGHYTFTDGEVDYYDARTGTRLFAKPFPHLSRHTAHAALFYEGRRLNARLAATYRAGHILRVDSQTLAQEDETGFHPTTHVDALLAYKAGAHWEWRLEGTNLTNTRVEQYSDSSDRLYNTTTTGRSLRLAVVYRR